MLIYSSKDRISAEEAYNHNWIKKATAAAIKPETANMILKNIKTFNVAK